jgi:hypothetical protein
MVVYDKNVRVASVERSNGIIRVNPEIDKDALEFILQHEHGHFLLQTSDELLADSYALLKTANKKKGSLKAITKALKYFDLNNKEHLKRYKTIVNNLLSIDLFVNRNANVLNLLTQNNMLNEYPKHEAVLQQMFIDWLKQKGIQNLSVLSVEARQNLLVEFMATPEAGYFLMKLQEALNAPNEFLGLGKSAEERQAKKEERQIKKEERQANQSGAGRQLVGSLTQTFAPAIGGVVSALGAVIGVPIPPQISNMIVNAAGSAIGKAGDKIADKVISGDKIPAVDLDKIAYESAMQAGTKEALSNYLKEYPNGKYANEIKTAVAEIDKKDKKKKIIFFSAIGGGVVVIAVVLLLVFKR